MKILGVIMLSLLLTNCSNNNQIDIQKTTNNNQIDIQKITNNITSIISFYNKNNKGISEKINDNRDIFCGLNKENGLFCFLKQCEELKNGIYVYYDIVDSIKANNLLEFINEILNKDIGNFNIEYFKSLGIDEEEFKNAAPSSLIYFLYKNNDLTIEKANELLNKELILLNKKNVLEDYEIISVPFYLDLIKNKNELCDSYLLNEEDKINTMLISR